MTTDELNAIVQAVMSELEKAGVDFDFKAETPQADDLVYVMRGTADRYMGITVKWQNLLDIIVQKATEAKNEAVSAKDIALQTLATIQSIESNISTMKTSVETTKGEVETLKSDVATMKASVETSEANVASMKASVETSEANVTQMKSDVSTMKASVEGTKTEVEGLKSDVTGLKAQTQTIVDNAKKEVTGLLDTKVDYTDALTYEEIMATNPVPDLTNKVASAGAVKDISEVKTYNVAIGSNTLVFRKVGKVVSVFGYLVNLSTGIELTGQVPNELVPNYGYPIISIYSDNPPYNTIGTFWIGYNGKIYIYKPSDTTAIYLYGTYTIS